MNIFNWFKHKEKKSYPERSHLKITKVELHNGSVKYIVYGKILGKWHKYEDFLTLEAANKHVDDIFKCYKMEAGNRIKQSINIKEYYYEPL